MARKKLSRSIPEEPPTHADDASPSGGGRRCVICGTTLSSYNPGTECWRHRESMPWRGPTARPRSG